MTCYTSVVCARHCPTVLSLRSPPGRQPANCQHYPAPPLDLLSSLPTGMYWVLSAIFWLSSIMTICWNYVSPPSVATTASWFEIGQMVWEGNNSEKFTQTSEYWQDTKILLEMISNQNIWIPYHHHRSDYLRKKHPSGWGIWHKAMQTDMVEQARFGLRKTGDSGDSRAFLHLIFTFLNTSLEPLQSIEIPNYRESEGLKWLRCRENHF